MNRSPIFPRAAAAFVLLAAAAPAETLYNGIRLTDSWPPRSGEADNGKAPPYLSARPGVSPIDVGRQLFVDDFLIEATNLKRSFHTPEKYSGNPVLKPETAAETQELNRGRIVTTPWFGGVARGVGDIEMDSAANPFDDGVFYDPTDRRFKMWYLAGHKHDTALAYSRDGLHWERPAFDVVPGTNIVIPFDPDHVRDSFSPWIDERALSPAERFKAYRYERSTKTYEGGYLYTSPDGIHWRQRMRLRDIGGNDDTSLFYNPFRTKWCLSLRGTTRNNPEREPRRMRRYFESADFFGLVRVERRDEVFWAAADNQDTPDPAWIVHDPTQLYAVAATPYESLMIGLFTIHYGPANEVCYQGKFPKLTHIKIAFSRDGFHWDRSNPEVFIAATKKDGDWDRGYVRAAGGGCLVVGDRIYFYYSAFSGYNRDHSPGMYAGGSTHVAMLRRDGFASMDAVDSGGELVTRPVRFQGKYLFVNLDAPQGSLTAEVLDEDNRVVAPFAASSCMPMTGDSARLRVKWNGAADLGALAGRAVRFRFHLSHGRLYAFWVSPSEQGQSNGYVGAGGPGFDGPADSVARAGGP